jgi:fused signal recognition particle receptor
VFSISKSLKNTFSFINSSSSKVDKEELEEILVLADIEYELVEDILEKLPTKINKDKFEKIMLSFFDDYKPYDFKDSNELEVDIIVGVNGAGKTTTIAKLAHFYKNKNKKVLLAAGDTFRAAALEQLSLWSEKLDLPIIKTSRGHDPSAVAYNAIDSAVARNINQVLIDTAGRLHHQDNLARELQKIVKTCKKFNKAYPSRKILVLDGTQGSLAIAQAIKFNEIINIDAIIITKLDGTSKGGAIFSIFSRLKLPILFLGVGEGCDDYIEFIPNDFIVAMSENIFGKE